MGRPLRLLNIALALVAVLIGGALAKTWVSPIAPVSVDRPVAKPSQEPAAIEFSRPSRPPLTRFDSVLEQNTFKQPPPPPPPQATSAPPPAPLPVLSGTILVGDERRAILSDKGKSQIYSVGQEVAGGMITEIKVDRVAFKRGDNSVEIHLKAAIENVPALPGQAGAPSPPVSGLSPPTTPPVGGGIPSVGQTGSREGGIGGVDIQALREQQEQRRLQRQQERLQRQEERLLRRQQTGR